MLLLLTQLVTFVLGQYWLISIGKCDKHHTCCCVPRAHNQQQYSAHSYLHPTPPLPNTHPTLLAMRTANAHGCSHARPPLEQQPPSHHLPACFLLYAQAKLDISTADLAKGSPVCCLFVKNDCNEKVRSC